MIIICIATISIILYNWQQIIWYLFYFFSYLQLLFPVKAIENKYPVHIAIDNNMKTVKYEKEKEKDYMFYYCLNYKTSSQLVNCKFINVSLKSNNKIYTIDLQTKDKTYYLENNKILGTAFIMWYASQYLDNNILIDKNYEITIIDNTANIITLSPQQYIILHKECYEITNI